MGGVHHNQPLLGGHWSRWTVVPYHGLVLASSVGRLGHRTRYSQTGLEGSVGVVVVVKTMLLAHTSFHAAMIALYMDLLSKHWNARGKRRPDIHKIGPLII